MAEKSLENEDNEIDGTDDEPEPELPPLDELELLPHAARTRPAVAASDVRTIFLVSRCNSTTSSEAGPGLKQGLVWGLRGRVMFLPPGTRLAAAAFTGFEQTIGPEKLTRS
jgi:hypothetical protein